MGNTNRPGTVVVGEYDHEPFAVDGQPYLIRELKWNRIEGRSYELVRVADDAVLTEDGSFDQYPTSEQIAEVLNGHGVDAELVSCTFCLTPVFLDIARRHDNGYVGSCCWDERLRASE